MTSPQLMAGLGAAAAIFFSAVGSAIASAHGGIFATKSSSSGIWSYAPIVIAGVLSIYGTIIGVMIQYQMNDPTLDIQQGYRLLCGGLVVGLGCLSSGYGMSQFLNMYIATQSSDASVAGDGAVTESSSLMGGNLAARKSLTVTWAVIFTMCFLEAIGLYSLIVSLFLIH